MSRYLLIKINSLARFGGNQWTSFVHHLSVFYNLHRQHPSKYPFKGSSNDAALVAQVLLASDTSQYLSEEMVAELLDSSGMVAATVAEVYFQVKSFLKKSEYVVTLGLVSLFARTNPFISIVHQDKNHKGECTFAANVFNLIHLDPAVP